MGRLDMTTSIPHLRTTAPQLNLRAQLPTPTRHIRKNLHRISLLATIFCVCPDFFTLSKSSRVQLIIRWPAGLRLVKQVAPTKPPDVFPALTTPCSGSASNNRTLGSRKTFRTGFRNRFVRGAGKSCGNFARNGEGKHTRPTRRIPTTVRNAANLMSQGDQMT